MKTWQERIDYAEQKPVSALFRVILVIVLVTGFIGVTGTIFGWFGEAAQVVKQELGPSALLKKYEWFKNASASLDEKIATVAIYEQRNAQTKADYGVAKSWPRDVREQNAIWQSELAGIKASYNELAADYNAQMAKINWAFCNVGMLPQGAENPLPREYKPYILQ